MSDITRESHYVPRATLRRWSDDGVHVWTYRVLAPSEKVPAWQSCAIKGLTKQRDLYTTFEGDKEGDDFEKFITQEIEEPGQAAIEKLVGNLKMKPTDWYAIGKFVAAQHLRTPQYFVEWVRSLNERMPATLESVLQDVRDVGLQELAARERDPGADYFNDKLRVTFNRVPEKPDATLVEAQFSSSRTAWLRFMRRMLTDRVEVFCRHRWRVIKLMGEAEWPLTDHPVVTLNYYGEGKYDFKAGWGQKGSEFILPVSPRLAVFTQVGRMETGPWYATLQETKDLQRFVVERALRWIIARKPASWIAQIRPRTVDAEAYATEQESWQTWNEMHLASEADFSASKNG